jgi:hypothetical protein
MISELDNGLWWIYEIGIDISPATAKDSKY